MSESTNLRNTFEREVESLERARDELRLKMHLAAADARDEFDKLESKWGDIEQELNRLGDRARGPLEDLSGAAHQLSGYFNAKPVWTRTAKLTIMRTWTIRKPTLMR